MNFQEAETFLCNEKTQCSKPGLERVNELLERLSFPGKTLSVIHVVGTNGKGSTSSMLTSCLVAAGYSVGTFQSPRLTGVLDYVRVNGQKPSKEAFAKACEVVANAAETMSDYPTEFELVTVVALVLFEQAGCQFAVLEAGMGGSKDATNLPYPSLMTVVTHIAKDHTEYLGTTEKAILIEKMGIAKRGEHLILGPNSATVKKHCQSICKENGLIYHHSCRRIVKQAYLEHLALKGEYQKDNLATVLAGVNQLREMGYDISEEAFVNGLAGTSLPFRFMIEEEYPDLIFDGGHNPDCAKVLVDSLLARDPNRKYVIITGVMRDKEYAVMYDMLDRISDGYITLTAPNKRALTAEEIKQYLVKYGKNIQVSKSIADAAKIALKARENGANILCTGSLYFMADLYYELTGKRA